MADDPDEVAPPRFPFTPRGSLVDLHVPDLGFDIVHREDVWTDAIMDLYQKAKAAQWDAARDIPWDQIPKLSEDLDRAVCQVATFLAENELIALYLPAKFLPRISPYYAEVAQFLATQIADEARHLEAFVRRARAGAGLGRASAETQYALKSLFDIDDYTRAKFLLNVLGEGTFEDLFNFIADVAPDPVTREIIRRVKADEGRHVAYGVLRTRRQLERRPEVRKELIDAIERRAAFLNIVSGVDRYFIDALAVLAGGGSEPAQVEAGLAQLSRHYAAMNAGRVRRLVLAGFTPKEAQHISDLHASAVKSFM
jgi:hypothetical protein